MSDYELRTIRADDIRDRITLRDYIAAHASESDIERHREYVTEVATINEAGKPTDHDGWKINTGYYKQTAEEARYRYADSMLRAREGGTDE